MKIKSLIIFLTVSVLLSSCAPSNQFRNVKNLYTARGKTLVCFGNSLTAGQGAPAGSDYPSLLAKELPIPVINAGRSGDTAAVAINRLEKDVLSKDPKIVIVELGANDFLRTGGRTAAVDEAFANIEAIIDEIQEYGAVVVIGGVSINYNIAQKYKKLAKKKGAVLIPNIMGGILGDPELKSDGWHPNAKGYRVMADKFIGVLIPLLQEME